MVEGSWSGGQDRVGGLKEGYVGITGFSPVVPGEVQKEVAAARDKIVAGTLAVYAGPIRDNKGAVRVAAGKTLTHDEVMAVDWLAEGVR